MNAESVWLVDPIDGTKSFVRECPFFSTQIALMRGGQIRVRRVERAGLQRARVGGAGRRRVSRRQARSSVSKVAALEGAIVSTGNLKTLAASPAWPRFGELIGGINRIRGYGDFVHYHLLARGALDVVIESDVNILDIAALTVIVEEAGGRFTDLKGAAVTLDTTTVLATNGPLHQPVLETAPLRELRRCRCSCAGESSEFSASRDCCTPITRANAWPKCMPTRRRPWRLNPPASPKSRCRPMNPSQT